MTLTQIKASHGKAVTFDAQVFNLIHHETDWDHPHASSLPSLITVFSEVHFVSQTTIGRLPSEDMGLLVSFKKGIREFHV